MLRYNPLRRPDRRSPAGPGSIGRNSTRPGAIRRNTVKRNRGGRARMVRAAFAVVAATLLAPALPAPVPLPEGAARQPAVHAQTMIDETKAYRFFFWDICRGECTWYELCCEIYENHEQ